jgi:hypothetical protein
VAALTAKAAPTLILAMTMPATAGPRKSGRVKDYSVDRQRRGQRGPIDEGRDQSKARRLRYSVEEAEQQCEREQKLNCDQISVNENSKQARLEGARDLGYPYDPDPVTPVGQRPRHRAQKHDRKEFGHRNDAEPCPGMS